MRYKGFVIILLIFAGVLVGRVAFAGSEDSAAPTVSGEPITVSCKYVSGVTSIRVVALSDVGTVVVRVGDSEYTIADMLPSGWAASRTISGKFVAGTVSYTYRDAVETVEFVCN